MKKLGFTLIELLVVIAIIGILIAVSTSSYITTLKQSRDAKRKTDLEQIRQALETYRSEIGHYPPTKEVLVSDYITTLPTDPKEDGTTYTYTYSPAGSPLTTYELCAATLEITSLPYCVKQP